MLTIGLSVPSGPSQDKLEHYRLQQSVPPPWTVSKETNCFKKVTLRFQQADLNNLPIGLTTISKTAMQRQMRLRRALLSTLMLLQVVDICLSSNLEASATDEITAKNSHWVDQTSENFTDRQDIMNDSTIASPVNETLISQKSTTPVSGIPTEFSTMLDTDDSNTPSKIAHTAQTDEPYTSAQQSSSDGLFSASEQLVSETTESSDTTALSGSEATTSHMSVGSSGYYSSQKPGTTSMHMVDYDDNRGSETTSMDEEPTYTKSADDHSPYFDAETPESADTEIEESAVTDVSLQSKDCSTPQDGLITSASRENDVDTITYSDGITQDLLGSFAEATAHVSGSLNESEVTTTENTNFGSENMYDQHHSSVVSMEPEIKTEKTLTAVSEQEQEPSLTSEMVTKHMEGTSTHAGGSTSQDKASSESAQSDSYARIPVAENIQDMQATSTRDYDLSPMVNLSTGRFEPYSTLKASVPQTDVLRFATEVFVVSQDVDPTTGISVDPVNTEAVEKKFTQLQTGEIQPSELMHSVDSSDSDTMAYTSTDTSEDGSEASTSEMTVDSEGTILSSSGWVKEPLATVISLTSDGETSGATDAVLAEQPVSRYFVSSAYTMANSGSLTEENLSETDSTITETDQDAVTSTSDAAPESVTFNDMEVLAQKEPEGTTRDTELAIENDSTADDVSTETESYESLQSTPSGNVMIRTESPTTAVESIVHGPENTATAEELALGVLTDASTDVSRPSEEDNFQTVASTTADEGAGYVSEQVSNETGSPEDYMSGRLTAIHSDAPLGTTETDQERMPEHEETDDSDEVDFTQSSLQTNAQPSEDSKGQVNHNKLITLKDVSDVAPSETWEATGRVNSKDREELIANEDDVASADRTTFLYLRGSQFRIPRYTKTNSARTLSGSFIAIFATSQLVPRF
ncbi:hypothetical protein SprV_0301088600 [Sparganum proliferum]